MYNSTMPQCTHVNGSAAHRPPLALLPVLLIALLWAGPAAAELTARLSQERVAAGQAVELLLTRTGAAAVDPPDLTPLETDFRILGRSSSDRVTVVDGQRRAQTELRLTLLPLRPGEIEVPSIRIGSEQTPTLTLDVAAATNPSARLVPAAPAAAPTAGDRSPADLDLSVDVSLGPDSVYVDQQAVLVIRVLSAGGPPRGRLHDPVVDGARLLPLGEDRETERVADVDYAVYRRHYALFPNRPGMLSIEPVRFDLWLPGRGRPQQFSSEPLNLTVQPIPAAAADKGWLPARAVTLSEAGPTTVRIAPGQVHERLVTLRAEGVMAEDLPEIALEAPFQVRQRDDVTRRWNERRPDGVVGYRTERVLISAAEDGTYELPGPRIDWWRTDDGTWQESVLPTLTLQVTPLLAAEKPSVPDWGAKRQQAASPPAAPEAPGGGSISEDADGRWPWISVAMLLAVLIGIWLFARRRRADQSPSAASSARAGTADVPPAAEPVEEPDPMTEAIATVEAGYRNGNAGAVRAALLAWAALVWPERPPANLARLTVQVEGPLRERIKLLEKAFFSPTPIAWDAAPETVANELRSAADAAGWAAPDGPAQPDAQASRRS
jgi:hypothetical protein